MCWKTVAGLGLLVCMCPHYIFTNGIIVALLEQTVTFLHQKKKKKEKKSSLFMVHL